MFNKRKVTTSLTLCFALALSACAGTVNRTPTAADADSEGKYNGVWQVLVSKNGGRQQVANWTLRCGDMSNKFSISVNDGVLSFSNSENAPTYYVAKNGNFKVNFPIAQKAKESATSDGTMANGNVRIILQGNLEKGTGFITHGIAELGYGGCTAKTKFNLLGKASKPVGA